MKIAAPAQHMSAAKLRVAPQSERDSERQKDNFADLLADMRSSWRDHNAKKLGETGTILPQPDENAAARAADLAPRIGTSGKAFGHGRLLVDTAVVFRDLAEATNGRCLNGPLNDRLELPGKSAGAATHTLAGKTIGSFLVDRLATALSPLNHIDRPFRPHAETIFCEQAPRQSGALSIRTAFAVRQGVAGESEPVSVAESSAPASISRAKNSSSPFGAQLAVLEGGLRLLLRLPRLADGERAELHASLARLFESFGHHNHQIVIQEIGKGDS